MGKTTKNQHFVPQMLLRRFATKRGRTFRVNVLDLERGDCRQNQNVANICSQNYFYDKNNVIEKFLEKNVEMPASREIEALCGNNASVSARPSRELSRFISVQLGRTAEAVDQAQDFINGMTKTMFRELARLNGFDEDAAERCRVVPAEPRMLAARLALNGYVAWLLLYGLEQHVVINRSSREFVVSDHPVVHNNLYLFGQISLNTGSLAVRGAQIFLPISPERLLCLYDPSVYKYGNRNSRVSVIDSIEDVEKVNILQYRNRPRAIMFRDLRLKELVSRNSRLWVNTPSWEYRSFYNRAKEDERGELHSVHAVSKRQLHPKTVLPFASIRKKVRRRPVIDDDRIPEAVAAFDKVMEEFKE